MFGILAKFFRFSGRENGNKFKLSMVIGLIEALASAMKIPAIMYILIGLLSGKPIGKYIGGSVAIMVLAIVVDVICKRYSTVLQTEGGYNASAFMRIKISHRKVFQSVYLFADTIENNIKFGRQDASHEEVVEAAKKACCHDFISKLPDGYDTVIGEGGATLSGGEKQRISIARAIMKDATIVILDEATANVDPENEKELMDAVDALTKEKTIIMIAHRLKTVRHADQIVVVDKGRIVQQGTHEHLMKQEGIYKRFVDARQQAVSWKLARVHKGHTPPCTARE